MRDRERERVEERRKSAGGLAESPGRKHKDRVEKLIKKRGQQEGE